MTVSKQSCLARELTRRVNCLPVPVAISHGIISHVVRWADASGEEWTVNRLKSVKLDLIRMKAGLQPVSSWFRRGRKTHFGGSFGLLERWAMVNDDHFHYAVQVLQCYSYFLARKVTRIQKQKFLEGVRANPPSLTLLQKAEDIVLRGVNLSPLTPIFTMPKIRPLLDYTPSKNRRAPTPWGSVPEEEGVVDSLSFLWESTQGYEHLHRFYSFYQDVVVGLDWYKHGYFRWDPDSFSGLYHEFRVGSIGLIQEPGYKLRAVANPGRIFQQVLEPLGKVLYGTLPQLPWDCTFDQTRAYSPLHLALSKGQMVYSVDLSGATDYFPLRLQEVVLRKLFPKKWIDLFVEISRGYWMMPDEGLIQWKRGQPLGLYPSFGAFALTHGILLLGLLNKPFNGEFFVLGDDVVILDTDLAQKYFQIMKELECPISENKSLESSEVCEFAGKVITKEKVIPQLKWRAISDDSFFDLARNLGPRSIPLFRPRQRRILERVACVPEYFGGLGWNPKGIPLQDRISNANWIFEKAKPVERAMSFAEVNITLQLKSRCLHSLLQRGVGFEKTNSNLGLSVTGTLDQRAQALTQRYIPGFLNWYRIMGKNLDQVVSDLSEVIDLPIKGARSRISSLEIWEKKLGRTK